MGRVNGGYVQLEALDCHTQFPLLEQ